MSYYILRVLAIATANDIIFTIVRYNIGDGGMSVIKLSIIVPCYNVEKYIDRCIRSLIEQTLEHSEYELILVDDASIDSTWERIQAWEKKFPKLIKAVHYDDNGRSGKARNTGLIYAEGEYIGYVDSDDWVEPDMFKSLLDEAYSGNQDIVMCRYVRDSGSETVNNKGKEGIKRIVIDSEAKRREFIRTNEMGYAVWDKIIKKNILIDNAIYFQECLAYEDVYYGTMLHVYATRIAFLEKTFYHYYVNNGSTVLAKNVGYHKDIMTANRLLCDELKSRGLWNRYHDELELDLLFTWYLGTVKVICLRFEKPPYDMYIQLKKEVLEAMPGCYNNPYIKSGMKEFYQLLVELLRCEVTPDILNQVAQNYRKL